MRISDWSSDVCSSDLLRPGIAIPIPDAVVDAIVIRDWIVEHAAVEPEIARLGLAHRREQREARDIGVAPRGDERDLRIEQFLTIGRASCRDRVCQYG